MKKLQVMTVLLMLVSILYSFGPAAKEIPFPEGYRQWAHIKTAINNPEFKSHAGFHHIYANKKGLTGYQTGRFPEGSILVFDVLESDQQKTGDVVEGKRKLVDVMVKDSKRFSETGGWGYQEFIYTSATQRRALNPGKAQCFNCHNTVKQDDFVFSKLRT